MTSRNQHYLKCGHFTCTHYVTAFIFANVFFPVMFTYNDTGTITSSDFTTLNISNTIYCLSASSNYSFPVAASLCPQIGAELALFDDNAEYFRVYNALSRNSSMAKLIWVAINVTASINVTSFSKLTFRWKNEAFNNSVWAMYEPNNMCTSSVSSCCARIRLGVNNTPGLADHECSLGSAFLCKAIPQCPEGALGCFLSCGDRIENNHCAQGFTYNAINRSCADVDECRMNTSGCHHSCVNTVGSFVCGCHEGYTLSGIDNSSCIDINECILGTHSCQQICVNSIGSYQCTCVFGYSITKDNTCVDIDECALPNNSCRQICVNYLGSYHCTCFTGYTRTSNNTCEDINECLYEPKSCQQTCDNLIGSFVCNCDEGFYLSNDGRNCLDVDECLSEYSHNCSQHCNNTVGSYFCGCDHGYRLADDQATCLDINECSELINECSEISQNIFGSYNCSSVVGLMDSPLCHHTCVNTHGSYLCGCLAGYYLDTADNRTCNDMDECSINKSLCEVTCDNTPGSYLCTCPLGYRVSPDKHTCLKSQIINQCPCSYSSLGHLKLMDQTKLVYLESLKRSLQVSKKDLLSHRLLLTCQQDDRTSSRVMGSIGVLILTAVFCVLIVPDIITVTCSVSRTITFDVKNL
ncbi:hypothetical protein Btru_033324 [Bulinus truncatus]|nr:hypothetical protein Btru_033324 [Bulinus truncatus]